MSNNFLVHVWSGKWYKHDEAPSYYTITNQYVIDHLNQRYWNIWIAYVGPIISLLPFQKNHPFYVMIIFQGVPRQVLRTTCRNFWNKPAGMKINSCLKQSAKQRVSSKVYVNSFRVDVMHSSMPMYANSNNSCDAWKLYIVLISL